MLGSDEGRSKSRVSAWVVRPVTSPRVHRARTLLPLTAVTNPGAFSLAARADWIQASVYEVDLKGDLSPGPSPAGCSSRSSQVSFWSCRGGQRPRKVAMLPYVMDALPVLSGPKRVTSSAFRGV
ncbi:hypothetical protein MC885_003842 [Smutsia gigantea]|nr:hypothetical protein MC885_003842 [Smutsia gigantea]